MTVTDKTHNRLVGIAFGLTIGVWIGYLYAPNSTTRSPRSRRATTLDARGAEKIYDSDGTILGWE